MRALCIIEHGRAPSTRLRLTDCGDRYLRAGIEVTVAAPRRSSVREFTRLVREASRHDVVVLFKTVGFARWQLGLLRRANPRIVFDFDDAVMFRAQKYRQPLQLKDFKKFLRTMRHCAAAVAGNDFLASLAEGSGCPAVVLPTCVDVAKYGLRQHQSGDGLTIGWLGLSDGFEYLRDIEPALQQVSRQFPGMTLKVISDKPLQLDGVRVENVAWDLQSEQTILATLDIGIMPLCDSLWTRGKCGYKILQYMAAGVPVVASGVGANRDIITPAVNGFLVRTSQDWVESLTTLIQDASLRREFGERGRQLVETHYSLDYFARGYIDVFQHLMAGTTHKLRRVSGVVVEQTASQMTL